MSKIVTEEYLDKKLDEKLKDYPTKKEMGEIIDRKLDQRFKAFRITIIKEIREEHQRFLGALKEEWASQMKALGEGFQMTSEKTDRYEKENKIEHNQFNQRLLALE